VPYDDRPTLVARLAEIRTAIASARKATSLGSGGDTITRPRLPDLLEEEREVLGRIEALDRRATGGTRNLVRGGL
jgi:hypothetical protein